ncbi:toxin [Clostridium botulinum]|uniref:TULIP family P47-like protein n=1 Tax=Clostridium botulinum TaxID=1491 RepID=UPI00016BB30B|nr:TULIP family P47-like protein [Clostridium botulinum]EDT84096.1 toxin complex component ORF-X2 [Clostridium botulinum Bf]MBY6881626.1 TULIP family P47-like protein [Clostridium botulinum]NEZ86254.1 toxin [Clostridium botulinum]NFB01105.1 toxin [Clostridium botulinum]NFE31611.1 toxin [Clostridium botulinum]
MNNLKPFIFYDWKKTILKNTKENYSINEIIPKTFFMELNGTKITNSTLNGTWKAWNLTDEGEGSYPVLKCIIDDGYLDMNFGASSEKIPLKNVWIKLCIKITPNSDGTYSISKKSSSFYIKDNSLKISKDNLILDKYLNKLMLLYFKNNIKNIEMFINKSRIQTKVVGDLSLLGWNTENSVSFRTMNEFIKKDNLYPKDFHAIHDGSYIKSSAIGTFDSWEMTTGADGRNIRFKCPIKSAIYIVQNDVFNSSTGDFLLIQVDLTYFNSKTTINDSTGKNDGKQFNLKIKLNDDELKNVLIVTYNLTDTNDLMDAEAKDLIILAFRKWFNINIQQFEQIFAYILLDETAKIPAYQWLKPTQVSYGSASVETANEEPNLDASIFSAMSMVENNANYTPSHAVDNRLLQLTKTQTAFGISFPLFMEHFLKQALLSSQFISVDDIVADINTLTITNNKQIIFGKVENSDGKNVDSYLKPEKLKLSLQNNLIVLELLDLTWEQGRGVTGHFDFHQEYELALELKSGKQIPILKVHDEPKIEYYVEEAQWKTYENMIVSAVTGAVFSIIIGAGLKLAGSALSKGYKLIRSKATTIKGRKKITLNRSNIRQLRKDSGVTDIELERISRRNSSIAAEDARLMSNNGTTSIQILADMKSKPMSIGQRIAIGLKKLASTVSMITAITLGSSFGQILIDYINAIENNDYTAIPGINAFMQQCIGAMQWPDKDSELKVTFGKLQGIYLLGGTLEKNNKPNNK